MAKKFLFVCTGVLMLAIAYHLVSPVEVAQSQEGEQPVLMCGDGYGCVIVMTDLGNLYISCGGPNWGSYGTWPGDLPTSTQSTTWGQIKTQYGE
ncbi:hypothetical protein ACFL2Z_03850 [Candidatus Eisenbacteria bacterium]|uniref:Secreted protein n=1 Tax=Eiseniibacteriota bacterium TaxID=2212470 RepID=A0ABV6YPN0_UNCEI